MAEKIANGGFWYSVWKGVRSAIFFLFGFALVGLQAYHPLWLDWTVGAALVAIYNILKNGIGWKLP